MAVEKLPKNIENIDILFCFIDMKRYFKNIDISISYGYIDIATREYWSCRKHNCRHPCASVSHLVQELGVSSLSVHCILTKDIHLFLYKLQMLQILSTLGKCEFFCFAETFDTYFDSHQQSLPYIWFSDEAHFWLEGYVNKQNCRFWANENLHE